MTSLRRISRAFLTLTMAVALFGFLPTVVGATDTTDGNSNGRGCAFGNDRKNGQSGLAPGCVKVKKGNNGGGNNNGGGGNNNGGGGNNDGGGGNNDGGGNNNDGGTGTGGGAGGSGSFLIVVNVSASASASASSSQFQTQFQTQSSR